MAVHLKKDINLPLGIITEEHTLYSLLILFLILTYYLLSLASSCLSASDGSLSLGSSEPLDNVMSIPYEKCSIYITIRSLD